MLRVEYETLCPVCGETLTSKEISQHVCLIKGVKLSLTYELSSLSEFEQIFKTCLGEPRSIQKLWMKRLLKGESFAVTAPTGIGKTKFGLLASIFYGVKEKKSYLIFPTSLLVKQAYETVLQYASLIGKKGYHPVKVTAYFSEMKEREKEEAKNRISKGEFNVLITTTQFLTKNFPLLRQKTMDFIFVDDVDALLKNSRNVEKILFLLGFRRVNGKWVGAPRGSLMIASATAKPGKTTLLFKELLGFDIAGSNFSLRNVYDIVLKRKDIDALDSLLKQMGSGGIIYTENAETAEKIYLELEKRKHKIGLVTAQSKKSFELFEKREFDFLIGTAHYYGTLVRGIDLPERIRFVVFYGAPCFKISMDNIPLNFLKQLIIKFYDEKEMERFKEILNWKTSEDASNELLVEAQKTVKKLLLVKRSSLSDVSVTDDAILFPDIKTYIQGSGRTSRLLPWGLTTGASFLMENQEDLAIAFINKARYYGIEFKEFCEIDLKKINQEIDSSREEKPEKIDLIKPALFIVESPTKAKHIAHYFGKPSIKKNGSIIAYEVAGEKYLLLITASLGHVTDLIIGKGYHGVKINNDENQEFVPVYSPIYKCKKCGYQITMKIEKCPKCGGTDIISSKPRIEDLRKLAYETGMVIIGTDPDSEGEKIAWDLKNLLSGIAEVSRAEFHEVTPKAIREALRSLREIDNNRVDAQIVRRIEDRWIGFVLSQHLQERFNNRGLAAGRVQTPVLGWIISQEQKSHEKVLVYQIEELGLELKPSASSSNQKSITVEIEIIEKESKKADYSPLPPFTTDIMLQEATQKLGFSPAKTMLLAQKLFESGLITYHRTDSTHVSDNGKYIAKQFLEQDYQGRTWGEAGTHECIRPTKPYPLSIIRQLIKEGIIPSEEINEEHLLLYDLIFRRFMASQAKKFTVVSKTYSLQFLWENEKKNIEKTIIIKAEGRAYELYPFIKIRKELPLGKSTFEARLEKKPLAYPFTEAEIITMMKEKGIGRPSTYAIILDKLFKKSYVIKKNNRLVSTDLGKQIYTYLEKNFNHLISEERTRKLMEKMDLVERGKVPPEQIIKEIYEETKGI